MPLGNLKTETILGNETINGDLLNNKVYRRNNQEAGQTPLVEPLPKLGQKHNPPKKKSYPKTDDKALLKANKKDLNNKNITE